jgi:CRP/FNR family transcriptional regulator, cyclic AMP receptor protein
MPGNAPALRDFLARTPFFGGISADALDALSAMLVARPFAAGSAVFRQGELGASMFIVEKGELIVCHEGAPGEPRVKLLRLRPGDFFGEMSLIEMQPRSASVFADQDAVVLELTGRDLYRLYKQDVKSYVLVLQNVNRELCRRLRGTSDRLVEWARGAADATTQVNVRPVR